MRGALSHVHWMVGEGNTLENTHIDVEPNASHIMLRNNVINTDEPAIHIRGIDPQFTDRIINDLTITNNTAVNDGSGGDFIYSIPGGQNITVTRNVFYQANALWDRPIAIRVVNDDLAGFKLIDENIWQSSNRNYVGVTPDASAYKS